MFRARYGVGSLNKAVCASSLKGKCKDLMLCYKHIFLCSVLHEVGQDYTMLFVIDK